ncbi:MAG: glycosyltransferase [Bacteroidetes bacterium]|nr:glycosyltransferase [Bacteroidota bacterium]
MKISIITATYNSSLTVRDTLKSIEEQDYNNIEHIIIDACSVDDTLKIVSEFPHVGKTISERDNGIYDAMNKGIKMATGDVVGILNSDDVYVHPSVVSMVAKSFENEKIQAVYADLQYVQYNDMNKVVRTWRTGAFNKKKFYYGWMPPHPTFFVRKKVYEEIGLFNLSLRSSADYEFMLRVLLKHGLPVHYIPEILVKMRVGGVSNATFKNRIKANKEDRIAWKINGLQPYFFTVFAKPIRKIPQFIKK